MECLNYKKRENWKVTTSWRELDLLHVFVVLYHVKKVENALYCYNFCNYNWVMECLNYKKKENWKVTTSWCELDLLHVFVVLYHIKKVESNDISLK